MLGGLPTAADRSGDSIFITLTLRCSLVSTRQRELGKCDLGRRVLGNGGCVGEDLLHAGSEFSEDDIDFPIRAAFYRLLVLVSHCLDELFDRRIRFFGQELTQILRSEAGKVHICGRLRDYKEKRGLEVACISGSGGERPER